MNGELDVEIRKHILSVLLVLKGMCADNNKGLTRDCSRCPFIVKENGKCYFHITGSPFVWDMKFLTGRLRSIDPETRKQVQPWDAKIYPEVWKAADRPVQILNGK